MHKFRGRVFEGDLDEEIVHVTVVSDTTQLVVPDGLVVSPSILRFDTGRGTASALITIENQDVRNRIGWQVEPSEAWLKPMYYDGVTPEESLVFLDDALLEPSIYAATLIITSPDLPGQSVTVPVQAFVGSAPIHLSLIMRD